MKSNKSLKDYRTSLTPQCNGEAAAVTITTATKHRTNNMQPVPLIPKQ